MHFKKTGKRIPIYRRVGPDEQDRGEPYPLIHNGMPFAHFGVGIGIYFAQLVILTGVTFICGIIMLAAVNEYQKSSYGGGATQLVPFSAACNAMNVTATAGCPDGQAECFRIYRNNCELPLNAAAADIAMCIIFCLCIIASKYIEEKIEQKLDESVQTAKDYSVEVKDPDANADDPHRWYEYFSQFGEVKYITILRRNNELTDLILKKHNVVRKIQESGRMSSKSKKSANLHKQYEIIDSDIKKALERTYPVCKVFVTFDSERDQHQCLNELEVPDYQAIFDLKSSLVKAKHYAFGDNVLDVCEPPEPDNILWQNLAVGGFESKLRNMLAFSAYVGILVVLWYLVKAVRDNVPDLLGLLVGIVDTILPTIFEYLTDFHYPRSEGGKQSSLQMRLFCARFLLSTIIPYLTAEWEDMLAPNFLRQILIVQIAACMFAPLMGLSDWYGLFLRHQYSKMVSDTQEEMNSFWVGSYWSIAEKYTGIAKVLFVSLFYALLTPISLLIATVAFVAIFLIDNYMLLRRWKVSSMLDAKIASRLRQQAILSVAAHMFVSMRFIYSWPMDQVTWQPAENRFMAVDKHPPFNFFTMETQTWMSDSQRAIFYRYKILLIIVCITCLHTLVLQPFGQWLFEFLCKSIRIAGAVDSMRFSSVESMRIYYPMLRWQEEQYLCSYAKNCLPRHRPVLIDSNNIIKDDLSVYVPVEKQKKVLSIVQYFGVDPIVAFEEKKVIDLDDIMSAPILQKARAKKVLQMTAKGGSLHEVLKQATQRRNMFGHDSHLKYAVGGNAGGAAVLPVDLEALESGVGEQQNSHGLIAALSDDHHHMEEGLLHNRSVDSADEGDVEGGMAKATPSAKARTMMSMASVVFLKAEQEIINNNQLQLQQQQQQLLQQQSEGQSQKQPPNDRPEVTQERPVQQQQQQQVSSPERQRVSMDVLVEGEEEDQKKDTVKGEQRASQDAPQATVEPEGTSPPSATPSQPSDATSPAKEKFDGNKADALDTSNPQSNAHPPLDGTQSPSKEVATEAEGAKEVSSSPLMKKDPE